MKLWKNHSDEALDRAAQEIRDEKLDGAAIESSADRVWSRLTSGADPARAGGSRVHAAGASASANVQGQDLGAERHTLGAGRQDVGAGRQDTGSIRECAGFRELVPDRLAGRLSPARALLFEDHVKECVGCRRALTAARAVAEDGSPASGGDVVPFGASRARSAPRPITWALAAAAAIVLAVVGAGLWNELGPISGARTAQVQSVHGSLYRVSSGASLPAGTGETLAYGDVVRTAKDSRAVVRLGDGSLIEMKDRSELSLSANRSETTIRLARGSIIVQAAKQRGGHLYVATDDCRVAVVGTIFSVNHGTKGSRVTVIEGEVHVEQGRREKVLRPGDQVSTHPSLETVPASEEIAWSSDAGRYQTLLAELKSLGKEIDRAIPSPGLRHSTALLDTLPARTVVYVAVPNLTTSLADAHRLIQERVAQSEVLREWWATSMGPAKADPEIEELIDHVRQFGEQLGEEIVIAVQTGPRGDFESVLLTAEIKDPESFGPVLEQAVAKANATVHKGRSPLRIVGDLAQSAGDPAQGAGDLAQNGAARGADGDVLLWTRGNRFVATTNAATLGEIAAILGGGEASRFEGSPFHARLAEAYRDGSEWLVGVDVGSMIERGISGGRNRMGEEAAARHEEMLRRMGVLDARHFIFESKHDGSRESNHATLSFDQSRRGLASWIAEPAPMGALDFVTSDATFLAGFIVKNPSVLFDDLYGVLEAAEPAFAGHLAEFEKEHGITVRTDLAEPLGGEIVLALDGPVLPVPSWKVVVEVYDPVRLQSTIERMIARVDERLEPADRIELTSMDAGGRTWHMIRCPRATSEVHYVYTDGYLIAAPSRALLERAIQARESGQLLTASEKYRALLPQDGQPNFSAIGYQDLGSVLAPLAKTFAGQQGNMTPEQKEALGALGVDAGPKMALAYGEPDRITFASTSEHSFASSFGALMSLHQFGAVRHALEESGRKAEESRGRGEGSPQKVQ